MAADFFQQQDVARRLTARLVVLFGLAVIGIIASIEVLLAAVSGYLTRDPRTGDVNWSVVTDPQLVFVAVAGTLIVVIGGSLYKIAALRAGGSAVAEQLGGRLLHADTTELTERVLLNVVEEMAIASGTPVPPVYLLDQENGINAFAAGYSPQDAVIGVTRGAATRLSRDELQGVIAHEFSHILNGDMRLNLRLIGLLHGILLIGLIGYYILRLSFYSRGGRRKGKDGIAIVALGAGLAAIGFIGTFFGNLIQAAVSRQREFLADASAVQFTRHPDGLAGALKKIGGFIDGSSVDNPNAPEASHLFFCRATSGIGHVFSTHPPLDERIRRIDPSWDGEYIDPSIPAPASSATVDSGSGRTRAAGGPSIIGGLERPLGLAAAVASIGQPTPAHLDYASAVLAAIPDDLARSAREPFGARAAIYACLLDTAPAVRARQLALLEEGDRPAWEATVKIAPAADQIDPRLRLPLLDIAMPTLRALTPAQYEAFARMVQALIQADERVTLVEWALWRILEREASARTAANAPHHIRFDSVEALGRQCELVLAALAYAGEREPGAAAIAYSRACSALGLRDVVLPQRNEPMPANLDTMLEDLDDAAPQVKRRVLEAAVVCVTADREVTAGEAELLRAIASCMSCPMPPILG